MVEIISICSRPFDKMPFCSALIDKNLLGGNAGSLSFGRVGQFSYGCGQPLQGHSLVHRAALVQNPGAHCSAPEWGV